MVKERKYCSDEMKKHFTKKLAITKNDVVDFESSNKCWSFLKKFLKNHNLKKVWFPSYYAKTRILNFEINFIKKGLEKCTSFNIKKSITSQALVIASNF